MRSCWSFRIVRTSQRSPSHWGRVEERLAQLSARTISGEEHADPCVGEALEVGCRETLLVPAEHGLVERYGEDQKSQVPGCQERIIQVQQSSVGKIPHKRCQRG